MNLSVYESGPSIVDNGISKISPLAKVCAYGQVSHMELTRRKSIKLQFTAPSDYFQLLYPKIRSWVILVNTYVLYPKISL